MIAGQFPCSKTCALKRGLVSQAITLISLPASTAERITPRAVPHSLQARAPALQCVRTVQRSGNNAAPCCPILRQIIASSRATASASESAASFASWTDPASLMLLSTRLYPPGEVHCGRSRRCEPAGIGLHLAEKLLDIRSLSISSPLRRPRMHPLHPEPVRHVLQGFLSQSQVLSIVVHLAISNDTGSTCLINIGNAISILLIP